MGEAMAPPHKRRKLASYGTQDIASLDNSTVASETISSFSHSLEHLRTHTSLAAARSHSHHDHGHRPRVQHAPVGRIEHLKVLIPRQGTGSSSTSSPATTPAAYATATINLPSPTLPNILIPNVSDLADDVASVLSISSTTSASSVSTTSSGNATLSTAIAVSSSSAVSLNLTTSAIILIGESTTTSKTTITLGGSTTTNNDSGTLYRATLSDGDVSTLTRSFSAYTTAFDGETFTVPSRTTARLTGFRTSTVVETSASRGGRSTVTSVATVGIAGAGQGQGSPTTSAPTSSSTDAGPNNDNHNNSTPPAGTIAGGVVGGCAGLAVVLLIAMLFVRWYRRKTQMQHQALPPASTSAQPDDQAVVDRSAPGMAERAGLMPLVAAIPGLMRHQNRSTEPSEPSERGFTRVSGRKLPSAFSEGMTSGGPIREQPPPAMPLSSTPPDADHSLSGNSFYRDSTGFYGGDGETGLARSSSSPTASPVNSAPVHVMMGPQRQPQLHTGGPYNMSPTSANTPGSPTTAFGRSETPLSSRFTEDM